MQKLRQHSFEKAHDTFPSQVRKWRRISQYLWIKDM